MGRKGISKFEVFHIANIIAANGAVPTIKSVRTMLGSGSSSTIHRHLLEWKKEKFSEVNEIQEENMLEQLVRENIMLKKQVSQLNVFINKFIRKSSNSKIDNFKNKMFEIVRIFYRSNPTS